VKSQKRKKLVGIRIKKKGREVLGGSQGVQIGFIEISPKGGVGRIKKNNTTSFRKKSFTRKKKNPKIKTREGKHSGFRTARPELKRNTMRENKEGYRRKTKGKLLETLWRTNLQCRRTFQRRRKRGYRKQSWGKEEDASKERGQDLKTTKALIKGENPTRKLQKKGELHQRTSKSKKDILTRRLCGGGGKNSQEGEKKSGEPQPPGGIKVRK